MVQTLTGLCLKLVKKAPGGDSEITLLLLQKHLYSDSREEKIAAAQIFKILYENAEYMFSFFSTYTPSKINSTARKSRKRISEIVKPARKDRLTLVRNSLKSIE